MRLKGRSIALLLAGLALAPAARAEPLKLERVVLLMRHGVRPPTHEPALSPAIAPQPWPSWDVPDGDLTAHGAQAITLLGAYDRALLAGAGVLPPTGCPAAADVTIYADVDERTVKTGEAFAAGLAPGCGLAVGHAATTKDALFSALDGAPASFDASAALPAMQAAVKTADSNTALLQKMQAALDPGGSAYLDLPNKLTVKDPHKIPKLSGPIAEGASGAEDFLLEYLDGKPMAQVAWGRLDQAGVAELLALHPLAYTVTARPVYIARAAAGPLARRIAAALAGGPALTVLVGHDTNIADLGGLLDLHWHPASYPADDPPPGGGLLFSLLQDSAGRRYVTLAYQVQTMDQIRALTPLSAANPPQLQPLPIPGCGDSTTPTACSLAQFVKLVADRD